LLSGLVTLAASVGIAVAAAGDLDTSFGEGGRKTVDFGGSEFLISTAVQPDGKIIAVGDTTRAVNPGDDTAFAIARLLPDGSLDPSFGDTATGLQIYGFGKDAAALGAVVQPDGKIIVAGEGGATDAAYTFIRLNPNGTPDPSFGTNGVTGIDIGPHDDQLTGVALTPDGKVVGVGTIEDPTPTDEGDIGVVRLTANGTLDNSFSGDGKATVNLGTNEFTSEVALLPDGRISVAVTNVKDLIVVQLTPAGDLDASFGSQGVAKVHVGPPDAFNFTNSVAVQPDGKLLVAGSTGTFINFAPVNMDFAVVRLLPDGTPDLSFDGDGSQTVGFGGKGEFGRDVLPQADGSILVAGEAGEDQTGLDVARLTSTGALDPSFGTDGRAMIDFRAEADGGTIVLQPSGRAVIAGSRNVEGDSNDDDFVFAGIDATPPPTPGGGEPPPTPATVTCKGQTATVIGTDSNEKLGGTSGDDVIAGLGGNDKVNGSGGDDLICGGDGKDQLAGGAGADTLLGEDGNDKLSGGGGPDVLKGGGGADVLNGGGGKNVVRGGPGVDVENP
jgi:uncharacterized delta-60 repeat protein